MLRSKTIIFGLLVFSVAHFTSAISAEVSQTNEIVDEIRWLQAESFISIATKHEIPISRAPGIATVITAKEIKQRGFRTLFEVLKTVPGFDIQMDKNGEFFLGVRGLKDADSKVKLMIDGHSINEPGTGGGAFIFFDLVVENAERIEIIRGPGSALYGRNAFLGIVNVVTKNAEDIDGIQWTGSYGRFDTQKYNMLFGKVIGDLKISGFFDYLNTEGFSDIIEEDILFPAPFSKSPGRSQNEKEKTDLNVKLSYKNLEINGKYMKKRREGYIGLDSALTDDNEWNDTYIFGDFVYKLPLGEKLEMMVRGYYDQVNTDAIVESVPEGFFATAIIPPFGPIVIPYPDGIKAQARANFYTFGFEDQFSYQMFERNKLTFGFHYEWIHQGDINFDTNIDTTTGLPLPEFQDFSGDRALTRRSTMQLWALYLQDEWKISEDIDVTVGVRHDQYTRFGGTTNPRFGLVWRFMEDAYLKFLFATAFRAPNFNELFLRNNISLLGNPDLDPEETNTYELGVGYNFTRHISGNINFFYNRIRDRILPIGSPPMFENSSGARIIGVESELKADFGIDNYAYVNYTYQDSEDTRFRNRLPDVPIHKANFGVNLGLGKYVNANLHTFLSGPRPRENGDTRPDLPSYALVDLTLIGKNFIDNVEVRGSVRNLFGKGYDDPAPKNTVPTDYPQQGSSFFVELLYKF